MYHLNYNTICFNKSQPFQRGQEDDDKIPVFRIRTRIRSELLTKTMVSDFQITFHRYILLGQNIK